MFLSYPNICIYAFWKADMIWTLVGEVQMAVLSPISDLV